MPILHAPKYISVQEAESYAAHAGFSNANVAGTKYTQIQVIVAIAIAESSLNIYAYNPLDPYGGSFGVLQINGAHFNANMNENDAYNPQKAFNYAYLLSQRGTNFNPWGTFTNKSYLQHIPIIQQTGNILPDVGWWTFQRYDHIGEPDRFGGFPKPDSNIQVPDGYPIANILPGIVSGINSPNGTIPAFGATVTIKLDKPLNDLADHISFLHLEDVTVRQGQRVQPGDIIGHSGGNRAAGTQKVVLGFALYHGEYYGIDGFQYMTLENLTGNGKLNPVPLLDSLSTGNILQSESFTGLGTNNAAFVQDAIKKVSDKVKLTPDENVYNVLVYLDDLLAVKNPFDITQGNNNPFSWLGDFLYITFVVDLVALTLRIFIFLLGAYLLFKIFNQMTNVTAFLGSVGNSNGNTPT
jgi:hypothetical protein